MRKSAILLVSTVMAATKLLPSDIDKSWKKYVMTRELAVAVDTNKGLIYDQRCPRLMFTFEDSKGNRAKVTFQCRLHSLNLMCGISAHFYAAKMIGNRITLKQAFEHPIEFGMGICPETAAGTGIGLWLASVRRYGGTFCMLDLGLGLYGGVGGLVLGGSLEMIGKPIFEKNQDDEEDCERTSKDSSDDDLTNEEEEI